MHTAKNILRGMLISLLCGQAAFSATGVDEVMKALEKSYSEVQSLRSQFTQRYERPAMSTQESRGELLLRRPGQMKWQYVEPKGKLFIADGKEIIDYDSSLAQAMVMPQPKGQEVPVGLAILMGQQRPSDLFTAKLLEVLPSTVNVPYELAKVMLTPKQTIPNLKSLELHVLLASPAQIILSRIQDDFGGINEFHFSGIEVNPKISAKDFHARLPKGTHRVTPPSNLF